MKLSKDDNMAHEDYEVIELGDDGAFDIPTSSAIKQQVVEDIDYHSSEWQERINREENKELLRSLKPSEFAVYHNGSLYWAIFRLASPNEELQEVLLQQEPNALILKISSDHHLVANIEDNVKIEKGSLQCKVWQDFVTVTFRSL